MTETIIAVTISVPWTFQSVAGWEPFKPGDTAMLPNEVADRLIRDGYARLAPEPVEDPETEEEVEPTDEGDE